MGAVEHGACVLYVRETILSGRCSAPVTNGPFRARQARGPRNEGKERLVDGQRFDRMTRELAGGRSRRSLLAVAVTLAGASMRGGVVRAQDTLGPGEPCTSDDQCDQFGGTQVCAENGVAQDGPLNCCRVDAAPCSRDNDCCGTLLCSGGACRGDSSRAINGAPLVAACASNADCAPSMAGSVICGDNLMPEDPPLTCCLEEGGACTIHNECCGSWDCVNGRCSADQPVGASGPPTLAGSPSAPSPAPGSAAPGEGDLAPGDSCLTSDQCSQALGPASCGSNGDAPTTVCCLAMASPCTNDLECCDDLVCAENGVSGDGGLNCCGYANAPCTSDQSCCSDLFCFDGVCQPLF